MRIVDLSMFSYLPPDTGGKMGIYHRLKDLSKNNDVYSFAINSEFDEVVLYRYDKINEHGLELYIYPAPTVSKKRANFFQLLIQTGQWLFSNKPRMAKKIQNHDIQKKITEHIVKINPDIIFIEGPFSYEMLDWTQIRRENMKIINVVHNQEVEFFSAANHWPAFLSMIEKKRIYHYEKMVMDFCDRVFCVAPIDAQYAKTVTEANKVKYVPSHLRTVSASWLADPSSQYIYFSGALTFSPNYRGILWFIRNVFQKYIAKYPDIQLKLTGRYTEDIKIEIAKYKNVELTGYLTDDEMKKLITGAMFSVIPVLDGGGVKMKLLEAMGYGLPIVTTKHGASGIPNMAGGCMPLFIAQNEDEFLSGMVHLTDDVSMRNRLGKTAGNYYQEEYTGSNNLLRWLDQEGHV